MSSEVCVGFRVQMFQVCVGFQITYPHKISTISNSTFTQQAQGFAGAKQDRSLLEVVLVTILLGELL